MIRQSLAPNAPYVNFCVTPANGISLQRRTAIGAASDQPLNLPGAAPAWLRLARSNNTFTASRSTDGVVWTVVATTTCAMSDPALIGLAVSAHNNAATSTTVFDNVALGNIPPTGGGTGPGTGGAGNAVLSFETLTLGTLPNPYLDSSGYTLAGAYSPTNNLEPLRVNNLNGNKVLINTNWDSKITLTKTGGGSFNLRSFRYASDPWGGAADATVTGTTTTGATVTWIFTARSITLQTLTLNWTNLTKVVIDFSSGATSAYGMIDDITLSVSAP